MKIQQWLFELLRKQSVTDGRTDGRTHGRTHGQRENSIPPTNKVCGGYKNELQLMANVFNRNCKQDRVTIHPSKSNVVLLKNHKSVTKKIVKVELNGNNISLSENTTHLGLLRAEVNENIINIGDRLRLARRTLYSLISTGVHGSNGLNPKCSYKIYQCYVLPRLLFGLEVLPLTQTQINILSKFHISNLRRFQSLPIRTATCAVYLLIGALPLEAELHKRQLGLLYNILTCTNKTIRELHPDKLLLIWTIIKVILAKCRTF